LGQQWAKKKSHQMAKMGLGFGHYLKQEIWANDGPMRDFPLKWAWRFEHLRQAKKWASNGPK
jgi:hypothetical protein